MAQPGREVLIKSVAQALPTYIMRVFKLPYSGCDDLTRMVRNFYWGSEKGKRKVHWKGWDNLMQPKERGEIGFRDFRVFNQALLARQAWRILQVPMTSSARVIKAKYFPTVSLLEADLGSNPSQIWRAILDGRDALSKGLIRRIGT